MERQWQSRYFLMAISALRIASIPIERAGHATIRPEKFIRQAAAVMTPDRSSLPGAVIRLAAVFACAGTVQILAGWLLR
jgi:hypothetical protein